MMIKYNVQSIIKHEPIIPDKFIIQKECGCTNVFGNHKHFSIFLKTIYCSIHKN